MSVAPTRRPYRMAGRRQAARATRTAIIDAVHHLLAAPEASPLTLEEVARTSGVTRATVYNHFGSRRALLTAAFADQGRLVRYDRVTAATALADSRAALLSTLDEACRAWERMPLAIRRVLALAALDPEIAAVAERFERARRLQMAALAHRLNAPVGAREAAVLLAAFTHPFTYYQFRTDASAVQARTRVIRTAIAALGFETSRQASARRAR